MSPTIEAIRKRIAYVAQTMLAQQVDLLAGAREIASLSRGLPEPDVSDPDVLTFVAVDSELDDIPMGSARSMWAADALAEKDRQRDEYLGRAKETIEQACRGVIARFL
jgi:hypothetical protein